MAGDTLRVAIYGNAVERGKNPDVVYKWWVGTVDIPNLSGDAPHVVRWATVKAPDSVTFGAPHYAGAAAEAIIRPGYDCKDGHADICYPVVIGGQECKDYNYPHNTGTYVSSKAEAAKAAERMLHKLGLSVPTNVPGKREVWPLEIVSVDD